VYDRPRSLRFDVDAAYFGNLETLPAYQNVAAPADRLISAEARLQYANARSSLGSVDQEKGIRWELMATADRSGGSTFPKLLGSADFGLALPLAHSSVWLRTAAGGAGGDRANSLAAVYFGGFGNNWVDHGDVKRYRNLVAFPGLEINEAAGKTFAKAMLEWNLPPLRFRRAGTPAAYASWLRPALFTTGLVTDPDEGAFRRKLGNVGAQVDVRLSILSRLDLTFSLGWAVAFEEGMEPRREGMISLKILE
jgi:hypothetical protein